MKALAFCLALATAAPAAAAWHRVDSPNFVVVGDLNAQELRSIAGRFEAFHEALTRMLGTATTSAPVPTVVVVFPKVEALVPYLPGGRISGGYASDGLDVNYIGMLNVRGTDRVIFHEYTHLVLANAIARPPLWLNEGLADFYSTFRLIDGDTRGQIGLPIVEYLNALNGSIRVPLTELLKVETTSRHYSDGAKAGYFYAESWALIHMLFNSEPNRVADISTYLRQVREGTSEPEAWEQVFGTARTENALRLYIKRPILNSVVVGFSGKVAPPVSAGMLMSDADTAAFLGALQLRLRRPDKSAQLVETALAREPKHELALAVMAKIEIARGNAAAARQRLTAAGTPNDWFATYLSGVTLSEASRLDQGAAGRETSLTKAATLLDRTRQDHGELANVLAELTKIELERDTPPPAGARANIERARALAPGRIDYILADAQLYAEAGEFAKAREVLGPLMTSIYPEDVRNSARRLMAGVVELEKK